jgi:hypothetical protein
LILCPFTPSYGQQHALTNLYKIIYKFKMMAITIHSP